MCFTKLPFAESQKTVLPVNIPVETEAVVLHGEIQTDNVSIKKACQEKNSG